MTEAITQQSLGFADEVADEVNQRTRRADAITERVARRLLRRRARVEPPPPRGGRAMTGTGAETPHGDYLPPVPSAPVRRARRRTASSARTSPHTSSPRHGRRPPPPQRVHVRTGTDDRTAADYTGLVTRAIAFAIDALIIDLAAITVVAIVALALSLFEIPSVIATALAAIGAVVFLVWTAAYFVTFWSTTGQTPGARVMRFRVLAPDAQRGHIGPQACASCA